jgi:hypothetical protein
LPPPCAKPGNRSGGATGIFPSIAKAKNAKSSAVGAGGSLADTVSKDVKVHSGSDF